MKNTIAILSAAVWISLLEFLRDQYLVQSFRVEHNQLLGLMFRDEPLVGSVSGIWSFFLALFIFVISRKMNFWYTVLLACLGCFLMMWMVTGDLKVMPGRILLYAIPLSMLEAFVAAWIIQKNQSGRTRIMNKPLVLFLLTVCFITQAMAQMAPRLALRSASHPHHIKKLPLRFEYTFFTDSATYYSQKIVGYTDSTLRLYGSFKTGRDSLFRQSIRIRPPKNGRIR